MKKQALFEVLAECFKRIKESNNKLLFVEPTLLERKACFNALLESKKEIMSRIGYLKFRRDKRSQIFLSYLSPEYRTFFIKDFKIGNNDSETELKVVAKLIFSDKMLNQDFKIYQNMLKLNIYDNDSIQKNIKNLGFKKLDYYSTKLGFEGYMDALNHDLDILNKKSDDYICVKDVDGGENNNTKLISLYNDLKDGQSPKNHDKIILQKSFLLELKNYILNNHQDYDLDNRVVDISSIESSLEALKRFVIAELSGKLSEVIENFILKINEGQKDKEYEKIKVSSEGTIVNQSGLNRRKRILLRVINLINETPDSGKSFSYMLNDLPIEIIKSYLYVLLNKYDIAYDYLMRKKNDSIELTAVRKF